ncbi:MAG: glycosyltransferase family 4 protein [Defluviitaleaceae bacterium]|nr:glycosyltransferase family 4 protein [Defluviitaleaceae bacterium]
MNIGIFTDTYCPQINGVATSVNTLKNELESRGHKVFIFTAKDPAVNEKERNVFRLPSMPFVFSPAYRATYMYPPRLLINMRRLGLDVIHTHTEFSVGWLGKIVSEYLRKPHVHTYHTMYEDYVHYVANGRLITRKMAGRFSRLFCNRAQIVVAPAPSTRESLLSYGVKRDVEVVPTGINFGPFAKSGFAPEEIRALRESLGISDGCPVIINVGRVAKEKSVDVLIGAMPGLLRRIPEAKLVMVGNGPIIGEMTSLAASLGVGKSVIFTGGKPLAEIGSYYQVGDVFATASTSETQGLTYYEAMASSVPVVAKRDTSIANTLIDGYNSYIFDDDAQLADVLYTALTDKAKASTLIRNAHETLKPLSSKRYGETMEKLYESVIERYGVKGFGKAITANVRKIASKLRENTGQ